MYKENFNNFKDKDINIAEMLELDKNELREIHRIYEKKVDFCDSWKDIIKKFNLNNLRDSELMIFFLAFDLGEFVKEKIIRREDKSELLKILKGVIEDE